MNLTNYEKETIITFNEAEKTAGVYTHNAALLRKLAELAEERPEECRLEKLSRWNEGKVQAADYIIPKAWVKIRPSRILSEEERARLAESAARMNAARDKNAQNGV